MNRGGRNAGRRLLAVAAGLHLLHVAQVVDPVQAGPGLVEAWCSASTAEERSQAQTHQQASSARCGGWSGSATRFRRGCNALQHASKEARRCSARTASCSCESAAAVSSARGRAGRDCQTVSTNCTTSANSPPAPRTLWLSICQSLRR